VRVPSCGRFRLLVRVLSGDSLTEWSEINRIGLAAGVFPYGMEHLESDGLQLEQLAKPGWMKSWFFSGLDKYAALRYGAPVLWPLLAARRLGHVSACLAVLEPYGFVYGRLRGLRVPRMSSVPLVAVSCWLAQRALKADGHGLRKMRRWLSGVDLVIYWSRNQRQILMDRLGLSSERLFFVPFGVETEFYIPGGERQGFVLAVGKDSGRDYRTLFEAVEGLDAEVRVACRQQNLEGLRIPRNVSQLGMLNGPDYRSALQRASVVVTCVNPDYAYPTGQSVLLQSMACQAATVVTDTVPLSDYTRNRINTVLVPPRDPAATSAAIKELLGDEQLRNAIGEGGRRSVKERFNAKAMWQAIGTEMLRRFGP
jgi:glycosyltransferase involved in cell wall biosynthesis